MFAWPCIKDGICLNLGFFFILIHISLNVDQIASTHNSSTFWSIINWLWLKYLFSIEVINHPLEVCISHPVLHVSTIFFEPKASLKTGYFIWKALLNNAMATEIVPNVCGCLTTTMLFKKADSSIPDNFRSIILVNYIAKIFTRILTDRLNT